MSDATEHRVATPLPCAVCDKRVVKRIIQPSESHDGRAWFECPNCGTLIPLQMFQIASSDA